MSRLDKLPKWARDHIIEKNCMIAALLDALEETLDALGALSHPHELQSYGVVETEEEAKNILNLIANARSIGK